MTTTDRTGTRRPTRWTWHRRTRPQLLVPAVIAVSAAAAGFAAAPTGSSSAAAAQRVTPPSAASAQSGIATIHGGRATTPVPLPRPPLRRFERPAHRYAPGHRGVDLAASPGTAVVSPLPGVVAFSGMVAGRPVLAIDHPGGLRSAVEPVSGTVPVGTAVQAGQEVGTITQGAHCPSSCVHWGVRRDGEYIDPLSLLVPRVVLRPLSVG